MDLEQVGEFSRVQSLGGWLVMIAVIRWRRVGSGGPIRVLRWGLRPAAESCSGGVRMVMWIAVIAGAVWGRSSPWLR